ncbi:hypothetical protein PVK06_026628 [Gossypium arboreum]|uniref:Uncharacterized protein n=1 Tax=Gossypium arboreum TaxID=29729 RepID=A0ABR0P115_GOSAR|nr:hypothetical protein PVK06_026628 [Gossypium arboreum]
MSPLLPRPPTEDTFGVIVQHCPLRGSMKIMFTGGETQTLFSWCKHLNMQKFSYFPNEVDLAEAGMVRVDLAKGISEDKIEGVRVGKVFLEVTMQAMDKQHKVVVANLEKSHKEALEKHKVDIMQSFKDYLPDLKSNFLLLAQVVGSPFDAHRVNFDAISHLTGAQLDFDIRFHSGAS